MKKILWFFSIFMFFILLSPVDAQMMEGPTVLPNEQSSTQKDEAAGKAVWDKLQNKQISCNNLKDDDFDVLGDFFMGNMMGSNHTYMNQLMTQRLGENGEKQMHIVIGKRLSRCNASASFPQGAGYFMPMMGFGGMMGFGNWNNMMGNTWGIFGGLTWLLIIIFLILGIIYFWKGVNRQSK